MKTYITRESPKKGDLVEMKRHIYDSAVKMELGSEYAVLQIGRAHDDSGGLSVYIAEKSWWVRCECFSLVRRKEKEIMRVIRD